MTLAADEVSHGFVRDAKTGALKVVAATPQLLVNLLSDPRFAAAASPWGQSGSAGSSRGSEPGRGYRIQATALGGDNFGVASPTTGAPVKPGDRVFLAAQISERLRASGTVYVIRARWTDAVGASVAIDTGPQFARPGFVWTTTVAPAGAANARFDVFWGNTQAGDQVDYNVDFAQLVVMPPAYLPWAPSVLPYFDTTLQWIGRTDLDGRLALQPIQPGDPGVKIA